jgi:hydantoinase/carbamoylase family amidase
MGSTRRHSSQRVVDRCRELAAISEEEGRLTRWFGGPAMARANALVGRWMAAAGMAVRVDAAGNLVGSLPGSDPSAGTLLLGSHLDTVRDGGAFDGPLGVLAAVECVERLRGEEVSLPFSVDVLGFSDEEGLRFGTAYLGSRAMAGTLDAATLDTPDADGVTVREAMAGFERASRRGEELLGYVELHIEQGPVLEQRGAAVGVVTAIAGATRAEVTFSGSAGHAGTVPMELRADAACALAELVLAVESAARAQPGLVATVGRLAVEPGAPNVIPGSAVASVDVRHAEDPVREAAVAALRGRAQEIGARRGAGVHWNERLSMPAVALDQRLGELLAAAVEGCGQPDVRLPSGAGHDAVAMSELTAAAMLFVRCAGGVSHHPDESVDAADVAVALDVLDGFLRRLAERVSGAR